MPRFSPTRDQPCRTAPSFSRRALQAPVQMQRPYRGPNAFSHRSGAPARGSGRRRCRPVLGFAPSPHRPQGLSVNPRPAPAPGQVRMDGVEPDLAAALLGSRLNETNPPASPTASTTRSRRPRSPGANVLEMASLALPAPARATPAISAPIGAQSEAKTGANAASRMRWGRGGRPAGTGKGRGRGPCRRFGRRRAALEPCPRSSQAKKIPLKYYFLNIFG